MSGTKRSDVEDVWRDRLQSAEEHYRLAAAHYQRVEDEHRGRSIPGPDSGLALQQALQMESQARAEYVRVLQIFTRLVLYGQQPEDGQRRA